MSLIQQFEQLTVTIEMAKTAAEKMPEGYIQRLCQERDEIATHLAAAYVNLTPNGSTLMNAFFLSSLRRMIQAEDRGISSMARGLFESLETVVEPVAIRMQDGSTLTHKSEGYEEALLENLKPGVEQYLMMQARVEAELAAAQAKHLEAAPQVAANDPVKVEADTSTEAPVVGTEDHVDPKPTLTPATEADLAPEEEVETEVEAK